MRPPIEISGYATVSMEIPISQSTDFTINSRIWWHTLLRKNCWLATVTMSWKVHNGTITEKPIVWSIIAPGFMPVSPSEQFWVYFAPVA